MSFPLQLLSCNQGDGARVRAATPQKSWQGLSDIHGAAAVTPGRCWQSVYTLNPAHVYSVMFVRVMKMHKREKSPVGH